MLSYCLISTGLPFSSRIIFASGVSKSMAPLAALALDRISESFSISTSIEAIASVFCLTPRFMPCRFR